MHLRPDRREVDGKATPVEWKLELTPWDVVHLPLIAHGLSSQEPPDDLDILPHPCERLPVAHPVRGQEVWRADAQAEEGAAFRDFIQLRNALGGEEGAPEADVHNARPQMNPP